MDPSGRHLRRHQPAPDGQPETFAETRYTYDGLERQTAAVFLVSGGEKWRTTTAYPGADRTDVTPPDGASATSTIVDARGQTTQLRLTMYWQRTLHGKRMMGITERLPAR